MHLRDILEKVVKKRELVSPEIVNDVVDVLRTNGGKRADSILKEF